MWTSKLLFRSTVLVILLSTLIMVDAMAGRCYLCSQATLAGCAGSVEPNSDLYATVLQYYTEPCNGQCVLFRDENRSVVRGCSWTYGHMTDKSTGWHELSSGVEAYFCDTHLCNNGTYDGPDRPLIRTGIIQTQDEDTPPITMSPQQLFVMAGNLGKSVHFVRVFISSLSLDPSEAVMDTVPRQLRQCYSCTGRSLGCGDYLDPRYVSHYIKPCESSCIIFRNPMDHNGNSDPCLFD